MLYKILSMAKTKKIIKKNKKNKTYKEKKVHISSNFESGNIIHIKTINNVVELEIHEEPYSKSTKNKYKNWFYFKASNLHDITTFKIKNLRNYYNDWKKYKVCFSYDNKNWKRFKTNVNMKNKNISWTINPKKSTIWFAYYPPYPFSKSKKLFPKSKAIGYTKNKNPILMEKLGHGPKRIWIVSGQHSGETINLWILEGLIKRLKERKRNLYKKFTFFIMPNLNPDGNTKGHWYVNDEGINLNIDWLNTKSLEVKALKKQMNKYGYDLVIDLHGDEGCKNHFLVKNYYCNHHLFDEINKKINKKNKHFQLKNYYPDSQLKGARDSLDDYTRGITIEGCLKHPIYNHKTLQDEPLKIGKDLLDTIAEL